MRLGIVAVCALALTACGGGKDKPPESRKPTPDTAGGTTDHEHPPDSSTPHDARDHLYNNLAGDLDGVDCDGYASTLSTWVSDNEAKIRRLEAQIDDAASIDTHLVNTFEAVMDKASDCVDHDGAQAAFDAFDELFTGG